MKFFVGVTDNRWYQFLAERGPDEVNFWRPGGKGHFRAIEPGALFLFKLHSPLNFIAGGGYFLRHSILPLSLAWQAFGEKNGAPDFKTFYQMISNLRKDGMRDPMIGCTILTEPFFFPRDEWIPIPPDWSPNIVQGKTYSTEENPGRGLWNEVGEKIQRQTYLNSISQDSVTADGQPVYGSEYLTRARIGQGAFRVLVTETYHRRCAITGERTLPVLEAAHIKPYSESGPNSVNNGLLLRSDLHILFDKGYLTVTKDLHAEVSTRIREEFENGRAYYALHGKRFAVSPAGLSERPAPEYIQWHNEEIFLR
ncbi:MAG TPA: HNH endonuclease [Salinimicrobium catena]|uniref:HNH endonuclease n=1 Tax=Salinimicrobium catena TaxID=390640 RepID=A0A7C2RE05_9FLAO|nr:HNH endonuclease [Salinimicrobium catena]